MPCYIISYDIDAKSDYATLHAAIKSYKTWAKITESTWAVVSSQSAVDIRNHLFGLLKEGDRLFVVKSGVEAAWQNTICKSEWLKSYL